MIFNNARWLAIFFLGIVAGCRGDHSPFAVQNLSNGYVAIPSATNEVQFRLYTNAAPDASPVWNTFDVLAYGETLLASPARKVNRVDDSFDSILVNGRGPDSKAETNLTVIEQAAGTNWSYVAFDATSGYRDRLTEFHRGILFVQPDLFVVWDHLIAREPSVFKMMLHAPNAMTVDSIWHDLRLEQPKAGMWVNAPSPRKNPRDWERAASSGGDATFQLGPTNQLKTLDLLTVYAVHRSGEKKDFAFRLLETTSAVGARIHRDGFPTLVAFKTDSAATNASLAGFGFAGPVGVDVFVPKMKKQ